MYSVSYILLTAPIYDVSINIYITMIYNGRFPFLSRTLSSAEKAKNRCYFRIKKCCRCSEEERSGVLLSTIYMSFAPILIKSGDLVDETEPRPFNRYFSRYL